MNSAHLLTLLTLFVACVDSSWDIIVSQGKQLQFYKNRTFIHTVNVPSVKFIYSITYDPIHYRVIFADDHFPNHQISSFDLTTSNIQPLVTRTSDYYLSLTYDPVTQLLFWKDGHSIYSFSLDPASSAYKYVVRIFTLDHFCRDIAVDSCGGNIYWIIDNEIERAQFDGSKREVLIACAVNYRFRLAIDQQTHKMYWTEKLNWSDNHVSIESADFNGQNRRTYTIENEIGAGALTVSNDLIYWHGNIQKEIWQLPKNLSQQMEAKLFSYSSNVYWEHNIIAANYIIKDQLKENQKCENLKRLISKKPEPDCIDLMLCVHGTKVSGKSRCECTQGYTGERCEVYVCQNYCLDGNCSVSADGKPKCSCNDGYSGQRCEVNACHGYCLNGGDCSLNEKDNPVCQCTIDYEGERCGIPICKDYCFQGNCNVSAEGQPICSCSVGYSGERCEFDACHDYCFNNGVCFLNEEEETACQCTADYEGERCHIAIKHTGFCGENMMQQILQDLRSEVQQVQVIKEDLQRTLQFYSDKNDENEVKIQKCEKSIKDLENYSVALENHDEITSKTLTSNTLSETN